MPRTLLLMLAAVAGVVGTSEIAAARSADLPVRTIAVQVVDYNFKAQYGRIWDRLHPIQRARISRTTWERCKRSKQSDRAEIQVISIRAVDSYNDSAEIPVLGKVTFTAVTVTMRYQHPLLSGIRSVSDTLNWKRYGGRWYGLLTAEQYTAYRAGRCPK